ncbi:hypothetical protein GGR28_000826 [Lewinella aquimaris]|uniref:Secretion system C-terminal sorting domain-containing protein n=1 Tax=Neolewinella aquimaris TaxID=1835722 RepID=A0A840E3I4_9BACT|nr:T9SS type A sorting domain-containing protein [Neolewinella aquimaris]MBB4078225.1 hypothetical protein [Neolewinella aquimaris]
MRTLFTITVAFSTFFLLSAQADLPFSDDFELGLIDSTVYLIEPNLEGENGVIIVGQGSYIGAGQFGLAIGKRGDSPGNFTRNGFGIRLNLLNKQDVLLKFRIRDFGEETHPQDGIYFSDDGGATYTKVWDFKAQLWCDQYGVHPPLNVSKLARENNLTLNNNFVIRFQQYDDADFSSGRYSGDGDGFALDDIEVIEANTEYATLPFSDDFELPNLQAWWKIPAVVETVLPFEDAALPSVVAGLHVNSGVDNSPSLLLGKRCDQATIFTSAAADLHLNLADKKDVILDFYINNFRDETHIPDGLYLSTDGGNSFSKIWSFDPSTWCVGMGHHPPLNLSRLAKSVGLSLTDKTVVRFQQFDDADFSEGRYVGEGDGFALDNIQVYELSRTYATVPFTADFEDGTMGESVAWSNPDSTALPFTGFVNPNARFHVSQGNGRNGSFGVLLGKRCDQSTTYSANGLDVYLNLSGRDKVYLDFYINDFADETDIGDGIYFSDNAGESFVKVWNFDPENWCAGYGYHPPLDVGSLAAEAGLALSDSFIIRFQQVDNADFSGGRYTGESDGFAIDEIKVYEPSNTYQRPPIDYDFEDEVFPAWMRLAAGMTKAQSIEAGLIRPTVRLEYYEGTGPGDSFRYLLGKRCDEAKVYNTTGIDILLDLNPQEYDSVVFSFDLLNSLEEIDEEDGVLLSVDGGSSFVMVKNFDTGTRRRISLNLSDLADSLGISLTSTTIVRIQQYDDADFSQGRYVGEGDGISVDNISVSAVEGSPNSLAAGPGVLNLAFSPNPARTEIRIDAPLYHNLSPLARYTLLDVNGRLLRQGLLQELGEGRVDISALRAGLYVFKLSDTRTSTLYIAKFVKQP